MPWKTGVFSLLVVSASLTTALASQLTPVEGRDTPFNRRVAEQIVANQAALQLEFGDAFAGAWIDYDAGGTAHQVVAVKRSVQIRPALASDGGSRQVIVAFGLRQLGDIKDALVSRYMPDGRAEPLILSAGVDIPNNRVFVRARPERMAELRHTLVQGGFDLAAIVVEPQNGPTRFWPAVTHR